ncbi:NAD(P)-dependent alcohol dehydrogenase [Actinosynnema sp. NPDC020468]|uniref:NAD(P)-dependent alcohol dehydrogenase n=1 Tax=Actinosynnema sp. NPDC020468 TaxID=3154488 RepID=UPI0033CA8866
MRAATQTRYRELVVRDDVPTPTCGAGDVLVRVRAAGLNTADLLTMTGTPYIARPAFGFRRPRVPVRGSDVAGVVEAVGRDVTAFAVGDEVFGWCAGAFAEHAVTTPDRLAHKPSRLTFDQAGGLVMAGVTALHALDRAGVTAGSTVLVNGASGGIGTFAVQLAKARGAEVTAVCSGRNADLVRSLGADHVVDYTTTDFTRAGVRHDALLDIANNHTLTALRRAVTRNGTLVLVGGRAGDWIGNLRGVAKALALNLVTSQRIRVFVSLPSRADLETLRALVATDAVTPVVDRVFPLADAVEAFDHLATWRARGKVVLTP